MPKDGSTVKSFRIAEDLFNQANEIFKKEGFTLADVMRVVCDATIREGRLPRGLSTREIEEKQDQANKRERYIDRVLEMAGIAPADKSGSSSAEKMLKAIFDEREAREMSNKQLREWACKWGLPEELSVGTLADLHDCGLFPHDSWSGAYDATVEPVVRYGTTYIDKPLRKALLFMQYENNIRDNLARVKRTMEIKAVKYLMECDNSTVKADKGGKE